MKACNFLFCLLLLTGSCSTERQFRFSDGPAMPGVTERVSSTDYTLYLRQVCVSDDKAKETYLDCPPDSKRSGLKKLEIEYLFVSNTGDRVIYITNFPDKYEYIYNSPGYIFKDKVNVNTWYFSKIYIGTIDKRTGTITFRKNDKKSRIIQYDKPTPDMIRFVSIITNDDNRSG